MSFNPMILQRKPSLFKPTVEDDKILKKIVQNFLVSTKQQKLCESNAPIMWERLPCGYRIIDLEIRRMEEILDLLKAHYFCSNKLHLATNLYMDNFVIKSYQQFILDSVMDQNSFCALEEGTGKIIGVAIASVSFVVNESMEQDCSSPNEDVLNVLKFKYNLLREANISENYNVDRYFCIYIVCVIPEYCGNGVGTSLVRACLTKAQKKKYSLCVGIFPAGSSYTIAKKFGFESLSEMLWINVHSASNNRNCCLKNNPAEKSFVACMGLLLPVDEEYITSSNETIN